MVKKVSCPSESLRKEYIAANAIGNHKNLLRLVDASIDDPSDPLLVFDMIRGQNLFNVLTHSDFGPRYFKGKESWSRFFFRQFLSGLYKIHQADFAHLDLRIDNLFINIEKNENGMLEPCLKFIDFGSAH